MAALNKSNELFCCALLVRKYSTTSYWILPGVNKEGTHCEIQRLNQETYTTVGANFCLGLTASVPKNYLQPELPTCPHLHITLLLTVKVQWKLYNICCNINKFSSQPTQRIIYIYICLTRITQLKAVISLYDCKRLICTIGTLFSEWWEQIIYIQLPLESETYVLAFKLLVTHSKQKIA